MSGPVLHHALFYDYVEDVLERRAPLREGHLAWAREWKDDGRIVMAGALGAPTPTGALFVFLVEDAAEIDEFVGGDPYVSGGIVTGHRVVPWNVVI
ncbi:MAG TPA: YciI family protein [Solirubrobacteraceae bacterium]|nr:YciI family protein [Solirubrobacteraceae bacterium]